MTDQSVLTTDLLASFDESVLDVDKACTLPPVCYITDEFLEFERRALFDHEWLCVGRADRVANPGDYFTKTVNGERLIIARAKDGAIHAFSAICQHRGMQIVDDCGNVRHVHLPVPPVGLRPRRPPARRPGDGAHRRLHQVGVGPAQPARRGVAGLRVRQLRSRRRSRWRPTLARYEPFLEHYDLANAVCPEHASRSPTFRGTGR